MYGGKRKRIKRDTNIERHREKQRERERNREK